MIGRLLMKGIVDGIFGWMVYLIGECFFGYMNGLMGFFMYKVR